MIYNEGIMEIGIYNFFGWQWAIASANKLL